VPLRSSTQPRVKTAMCTQQVWDAQWIERRVPGHLEFWFRYHLQFLGIDVIYLYDLDGTFADIPLVSELREAGRVIYEDAFSRVPPLPDIFERYGLQTNTAHYAQTMVQHHCWQHARHTADWVISSSHGWDMFLFSPRGESLQALLSRLPPGEMSVVEGLRYGTREEPVEHPNVLGRFPHHIDTSASPEVAGPPERMLIADPRLVASSVLSDFVPRPEAPVAASLACDGPDFIGPRMRGVQKLSRDEWRANHYVQLHGNRGMLFAKEEGFPELREFVNHDALAALLGDNLAEIWGAGAPRELET